MPMMPIVFTTIPSPLGGLTLAASETGLTAVWFPTSPLVPPLHNGSSPPDPLSVPERGDVMSSPSPEEPALSAAKGRGGQGVRTVQGTMGDDPFARAGQGSRLAELETGLGSEVLARAREQLNEYFARSRTTFDLPLDPAGSPFERRVWEALRAIPYGSTVSYGELARRLGDPRATRAVGAANGKNPIPIIVPCHRVVGARGELTGFGGGLDRKRWLLEHEGAALALGY